MLPTQLELFPFENLKIIFLKNPTKYYCTLVFNMLANAFYTIRKYLPLKIWKLYFLWIQQNIVAHFPITWYLQIILFEYLYAVIWIALRMPWLIFSTLHLYIPINLLVRLRVLQFLCGSCVITCKSEIKTTNNNTYVITNYFGHLMNFEFQ